MCGRFTLWITLNIHDHYGIADDPGIVVRNNDPDCIVPVLLPDEEQG